MRTAIERSELFPRIADFTEYCINSVADSSRRIKGLYQADYATALRLVRPPANQGNERAQVLLGICTGMEGSAAKRSERLNGTSSSRQEDPYAQYMAGIGFFSNGQQRRALKWYWNSAEQGYGPAHTN